MKNILIFKFTLLLSICACFSPLKAQDTILMKHISKRYAYQICVFANKGSRKAFMEEKSHIIRLQQNDSVKIALKDKVLGKIIPFIAADSASVVAEYSLGVPSNQMFLRVAQNGELVFYPTKVPNYENLVPIYEITPCQLVLSAYMSPFMQLNEESEVGKIFCNLYDVISAKKTFNPFIFSIVLSYQN